MKEKSVSRMRNGFETWLELRRTSTFWGEWRVDCCQSIRRRPGQIGHDISLQSVVKLLVVLTGSCESMFLSVQLQCKWRQFGSRGQFIVSNFGCAWFGMRDEIVSPFFVRVGALRTRGLRGLHFPYGFRLCHGCASKGFPGQMKCGILFHPKWQCSMQLERWINLFEMKSLNLHPLDNYGSATTTTTTPTTNMNLFECFICIFLWLTCSMFAYLTIIAAHLKYCYCCFSFACWVQFLFGDVCQVFCTV